MGNSLRRLHIHREAKKRINKLFDDKSHVLIVHYSCESFYNIKDGKTPRVTSIAVRFLNSGQTKSFSIHKVAELRKISLNEISKNYDFLEKEMLTDFFKFLKEHKGDNWIHWNMRDINYGFEALQYRAEILGATTFELPDANKFDLAILLIEKYGNNYSSHPRLSSILEMNNLHPKHWLTGDEEAKAFDIQDYVKLHQSTLAKVCVIETLLSLAAQEELKTKSKFKDKYGITFQGLYELTQDHWLFSLLLFLISVILGVILSDIFKNGCG